MALSMHSHGSRPPMNRLGQLVTVCAPDGLDVGLGAEIRLEDKDAYNKDLGREDKQYSTA